MILLVRGIHRTFQKVVHLILLNNRLLKLRSTHATAGSAYSPLSNVNEESTARLCDSGLPDPDVCDVLITPSLQRDILEEAWARG